MVAYFAFTDENTWNEVVDSEDVAQIAQHWLSDCGP